MVGFPSIVTEPKRDSKPGPEAERLKIEMDPKEALRRLLTKPPPDDDEGQDDETGDGEDAEPEA